jgi:hypothetical protein
VTTIDAIVMATAALLDATVVTGDPRDFERRLVHFPASIGAGGLKRSERA